VNLLEVRHLSKRYESFQLDDVSFALPPGYIMGFIGRNGAGKTTTIKSLLNLVHPDSGTVTVLGQDFYAHELELKKVIGLTVGGVAYYPRLRLARITDVFRRFYDTWDEAAYRAYLRRFDLVDTKRVQELSAGMSVKYALALALSHDAKLLILDEPTSGLDPVSRDDLLDVFREIIEAGERSILFSTQITSDLDKCADYITYIKQGRVIASAETADFVDGYRLVGGRKDQLTPAVQAALVGSRITDLGFTGLTKTADAAAVAGLEVSVPDIEQIMVFVERGQATTGATK
jgi:ABC-2 type transport system ATP-binding protein